MTSDGSNGTLFASLLLGVAALAIFFLEFVLPTGGLLAILCALSAIASVVLGFMYDATTGMILLALYAVAAPFMLMFALQMATKSRLGRRMVLRAEDPARTNQQAQSSSDANDGPRVGAVGEAMTPLRPAGYVRFDGRRVDASAEGDLIDAGTLVEVVSVRDGQVRVRPHRQ
ncbi:MAG: hypothetical protein DWH97_00010 [Planctomycetota bacterium]|jgi:membrane-bound serine protease (ClpP class)|nr:MAG: hypothetical protein DWH97_00010 [Planctomycetota bacterium]RLS96405.1 MAG: hypothetical protein DWI12_01865 [Planctomycetota bacterium]